MVQQINRPVQVQARTHEGQLVPMQVTLGKKNYAVAKVEQRRRRTLRGHKVEEITVSVVSWKKMTLEHDHSSKTWLLLTVEENG